MRRLALAVVALAVAASAGATPREPLVVSELPEPKLVALTGPNDPSPEQTLDEATARFSRAISAALQSDQRAIELACRSGAGGKLEAAARYQWQAHCFYRRH
jgi:hypothetical protein